MQFEEAAAAADEATMRSMLAADPGLRDRHADLVPRMAEARTWSTVRACRRSVTSTTTIPRNVEVSVGSPSLTLPVSATTTTSAWNRSSPGLAAR